MVWGWEKFVGRELVKIIIEVAVNNPHSLRRVWNEKFRRATAESRGLYPEGLDKGFVANLGVLNQICPLDDFHENGAYSL